MNDYTLRLGDSALSGVDELTPERINRLHRFRRRLAWRRVLATRIRPLALPAALLLVLGGVASVPLPVKAAHLGSGFSERIVGGASVVSGGNAVAGTRFAGARVEFTGALSPSARRTALTITIQKISGADAATVGSMMTTAQRVFNTRPVALPTLLTTLGITAQPGGTYRIAVSAGNATLTSTTVTLAR